MATLSVLGLYTFDDTLFDLMCWPDDFTADEKQAVIDNICMECAELEILYPDAGFLKKAIGAWSFKEKPVWNRIYSASKLEYNPIENYRRHETETIEDDRTEQHSGSDSSIVTNSGSSTGTDEGVIDHYVTGYDSGDLVLKSQDSTNGRSTSTDSQNGTSQLTHGEKIEHDNSTDRSLLAYGNIGVTTSQEMLKQEIEIASLVNIMPIMVQSFMERFCIMVY